MTLPWAIIQKKYDAKDVQNLLEDLKASLFSNLQQARAGHSPFSPKFYLLKFGVLCDCQLLLQLPLCSSYVLLEGDWLGQCASLISKD